MSRAGQAGEVGSVFRGAVATHIAVHGLRSRSIQGLDLPAGVDPVRLEFETSDPTDDIRVTFSDSRRAYVAVKRKVTRGRPLNQVVAGWVAQALALGADDLLVIAGEEFAGPAKNLDGVLRRHRAGLRMETRDERDAFHAIADLVPVEVRELVLDRARVLHLPEWTGGGVSRDLLVALMDLAVVDTQGQQAVSTLADLFHRQAGAALGSDIDDWVTALNSAGLTVIADKGGPAGMRVASRLAAVGAYRDRLKADAGRIDLSLLAEDLPPIVADDLVDGLMIDVEESRTPERLLHYVRRWRRMLIVGQPGSGKSVAMREIAARCATDPKAPIPILVALPRLTKGQPERLTIDGIVDQATTDAVSDHQRSPLAEYLTGELANGGAIILCDGLDECGARAPWVAQQLANILGSVHPKTGFILATRANAQIPAARLGLPRVELASPHDLQKTVDRVLEACAAARLPDTERDAWLAARRTWIKDAKDQHGQLLTVPLLAVLLALVFASAPDADLPKGRATLLHGAVEQSVRRWEQTRSTLDTSRPWLPALTTTMLLDGFIALGRILDGGATPSRADALSTLGDMLKDPYRWAMPPAQALEVAEQVLRFWDEHVAVFVVNAADQLTTRSKVFAEIATAMWASQCEQDLLTAWLTDALQYTDSDGAIALAAGLDPRAIGALVSIGAYGHTEATLMVADLATNGTANLTSSELESTLDQLRSGVLAAREGGPPARRGPRNPPPWSPTLWDQTRAAGPWPFVQAACRLALPADYRRLRADLVADGVLDDRSEVIAAALCELTDAATDNRPLGEKGVVAVTAALAIPLPAEGKMVPQSRRRSAWVSGGRLAPGLAEVVLAAAGRLDELPDGSGERAFQIATRAGVRTFERISTLLARAGVDTSLGWWSRITAPMAELLSAHKEYDAALLSDLIALADPNSTATDGFWSLSDIGDLLAATGYMDVGVNEFGRAFVHDSPRLRRTWLDAIADAYGINKSAVGRQARYLEEVGEDARNVDRAREDWFVASTRPIVEPSLTAHLDSALTNEQKETLLSCVEADSDWIASAAGAVLVNLKKAPWDSCELLDRDMSEWPRRRAGLLYMVAILSARDDRRELLARAAASDSPDHRYAARMTIAAATGLDADGSLMAALRQDIDLSVRPKDARNESPTPVHWTCGDCRAVNDVNVEDCSGCDDGVRPDY